MNIMKNLGTWLIVFILTVFILFLLAFYQIDSIIHSKSLYYTVHPTNYASMFQTISTKDGTLFYYIDKKITENNWILNDTNEILKTTSVKKIVSFVLEHHKKESFDSRISQSELLSFINKNIEQINKDFKINWTAETKPIIVNQLANDLYEIITLVPEKDINTLLEVDNIQTLLPPITQWILIGGIGIFALLLILIHPHLSIFKYLLLPSFISAGYSFLFATVIQLMKDSDTTKINFLYQFISSSLDKVSTFSIQSGICFSVASILFLIITIIYKLNTKKS